MEDIRTATRDDAGAIGRLMHDFGTEFDEPSAGAAFYAQRFARLIGDDLVVLLLDGPEDPHGFAVLRLRPSLYSDALEAYLAELYVAPEHRGRGGGRALLDAALQAAREAGADHFWLNTEESDVVARVLYVSAGLTNRLAGGLSYFYEREL